MGVTVQAQSAAVESLKFVYNNTNSVPYKWRENGEFVGPLFDIIREVSRRTGIEIKTTAYPAKRVQMLLEKGLADGAFGLSRKVAREKVAFYLDEPIGWANWNIFVLKGNEFVFDNLIDLHGKTIGVVRGIPNGKAFQQAVGEEKINTYEIADYSSLVEFLNYGRTELIAGPTASLQHAIDKQGLSEKIVKLPHLLRPTVGIHVVISKKADVTQKQTLINTVNETLVNMRNEKVMDDIYQKYGYSFK